MKPLHLFIVMVIFCHFGCSSESKARKQVSGEWKAISLTEEGDTVQAELDVVCLDLHADGRYTFFGTLKYFEHGHFDIENNKLIISAIQGASDSTARSMDFTIQGKDTMLLSMLDQGQPRLLTLVRLPND